MSKGLSEDQQNAVTSEEVKTRTLLSIYLNTDDSDVLRVLENDTLEILEIDNQTFIAGCVQRSDVKTEMEGSVESCSITLSNIHRDISSIIVNEGDVALQDAKCVVQEVIFNTEDNVIGEPVELFTGKVNNIQLNAAEFTFDVERNLGGHSFESPRTSYDVSCQWNFKDERCQYAGSGASCDKTLTRCKALGNVHRFGGYPSIPVEMSRR